MKNKLGQHFLENTDVVKSVVSALDINKNDAVIEVGPGKGALTEEILRQTPKVYVGIEKDKKLVDLLEKRFANQKIKAEVNFVHGDILKILPKISSRFTSYKVVGNIPFYLTGYLLRTVGELKEKPEISVFLMQKEVAERLSAKPPKMGLLAASVQVWADVKYLGEVPRKNFKPAPDVDGGVVILWTIKKPEEGGLEKYYKTAKILFRHPRKTVLNNLKADEKTKEFGPQKLAFLLEKTEVPPQSRPEELGVEKIKKITKLLW